MVAVTGATGHLGVVLVRELLDRGEVVRCLMRSGSRSSGLETEGAAERHATRHDVDLFDESGLIEAFRGASVVYHAAGLISFMPGSEAELHRVNVEATRAVLRAARSAGVRRFVYVGSVEAFPLEDGPYPITERHPIDPERTVMAYGRSKALGLQAALDASDDEFQCVACCPTAFLGPPDFRLSALGRFVVDAVNGRLPASIEGGFDFVDVRDVAAGVIRAGEAGRAGRVYLLGGAYLTVEQILSHLEMLTGVPGPTITLPVPPMLRFAPLVELYYRARGKPPRFTSGSLRLLSLGVRVDSSRARAELGYTTRPITETLADTVAWFIEQGSIDASRLSAPDELPSEP